MRGRFGGMFKVSTILDNGKTCTSVPRDAFSRDSDGPRIEEDYPGVAAHLAGEPSGTSPRAPVSLPQYVPAAREGDGAGRGHRKLHSDRLVQRQVTSDVERGEHELLATALVRRASNGESDWLVGRRADRRRMVPGTVDRQFKICGNIGPICGGCVGSAFRGGCGCRGRLLALRGRRCAAFASARRDEDGDDSDGS
jgi:hypothetical protein